MSIILHNLTENEKGILENFFIKNKQDSNKNFKEFSNAMSQKYDLLNNNVELIWDSEINETARMFIFNNKRFKPSKTKDKAFALFSKDIYFLNKKNQSFLNYLQPNIIRMFNLKTIDINYLILEDIEGNVPIINYIKELNIVSKEEIEDGIIKNNIENRIRLNDFETLINLTVLVLESNIKKELLIKNKTEITNKINELIDVLFFTSKKENLFSKYYIDKINTEYIPILTKSLSYLDLITDIKNENKVKKYKI